MTALALCESRVMVAVAGLLVPNSQRAEWRAEWNSEMWHAWHLLLERGESRADAHRKLREWTSGAFQDALCCRFDALDRERMMGLWQRWVRTPAFCLGVIGAVLVVLIAASGLLPVTRSVLIPLPYADAGRVVTVAQGGVSIAMRSGPRLKWTRLWQSESRTVQQMATYVWQRSRIGYLPGAEVLGLDARVSERFFSLLGASPAAGRLWTGYPPEMCGDCAVLSYDFAVSKYGNASDAVGRRITVDGRAYHISGVLSKRFWFLSRRIAVWTPASAAEESDPWRHTGVVARLAPEVSPAFAAQELLTIAHRHEPVPWDVIVTVSPVQERVRSVLLSFGLGLLMATVIVLAGVHLRIPLFPGGGTRLCWRLAPFFAAKTTLLLLVVLLTGLEFTAASSITMIGGTDLATEPISTWLFLVGSMCALSWSIHDQRRRCRVCVRRLGLCAQVGCSGCLLLNWAGTEMVCIEGHGMLHVPEMVPSWDEPERWTALDESWQELFVSR